MGNNYFLSTYGAGSRDFRRPEEEGRLLQATGAQVGPAQKSFSSAATNPSLPEILKMTQKSLTSQPSLTPGVLTAWSWPPGHPWGQQMFLPRVLSLRCPCLAQRASRLPAFVASPTPPCARPVLPPTGSCAAAPRLSPPPFSRVSTSQHPPGVVSGRNLVYVIPPALACDRRGRGLCFCLLTDSTQHTLHECLLKVWMERRDKCEKKILITSRKHILNSQYGKF